MSADQNANNQQTFADVDINNGVSGEEDEGKRKEVLPVDNDLFNTPTSETHCRISSSCLEDVLSDNEHYYIEIIISEPQKVGDGISSYLAYKVTTKTNIPKYKRNEFSTLRRFSDFLGIHVLLTGKYTRLGIIIPPALSKNIIESTKAKMCPQPTIPGSDLNLELVETRRAVLQRFVNRVAKHPILRVDLDFINFLESDQELPRSVNTSTLSGAGVMQDKALKHIVKEKYIYDYTFPSFKAGTDSKEITSRLNQAFNKNLQSFGIVFVGDDPIKIADIACGPADTTIKYLMNINYSAGFDIRVTDHNLGYAGEICTDMEPKLSHNKAFMQKRGQAYNNLLEAKLSLKIPIIDFTVTQGDAFEGNLNILLSKNGEIARLNTFKIAYLSHAIYHASSDEKGTCLEKVERIIYDISKNILDTQGIGVMYHVSYSPNTMQDFIVKYGNNCNKISPSDCPVKDNAYPTTSIAESCKKQKIPCYELEFATKLYFSDNVKEYAEVFRDPECYDELLALPKALEDYNKLLFIVQRAINEMATDKSDTGLVAYIDDIMSSLCQNEKNQWYLPSTEKMQIILNLESSLEFQEKVRLALDQTARQLPEIIQQGISDFEERVSAQSIGVDSITHDEMIC